MEYSAGTLSVVSGFIMWNALMNYSDRVSFFFFFFLFVIDSIHFILFITMLFIWHDFCFVAPPFINSLSCYYNLIWVIWCLTFTVIWCITLIWRSTQHHVYHRNSMTASHKIAISNLIYFHQYLLIHYECWMLFFFPTPQNVSNYFSKFLFFFTSSVLNLYYPFHPVSKSQSAIVVWITSDKTSPFVCLAVGSVQVMFALSLSLSLPIKCTHTHWYYRESDFNRRCWLHANHLVQIFICEARRSDICFP